MTLKYGNTKDTCDGKEDEEENIISNEEDDAAENYLPLLDSCL